MKYPRHLSGCSRLGVRHISGCPECESILFERKTRVVGVAIMLAATAFVGFITWFNIWCAP